LDNTVIVEEAAVWREAETGKESDTAIVASVFVLENGLITSVQRYDSLHNAFEGTGLNEKNLITK